MEATVKEDGSTKSKATVTSMVPDVPGVQAELSLETDSNGEFEASAGFASGFTTPIGLPEANKYGVPNPINGIPHISFNLSLKIIYDSDAKQ